VGGYSGPAVVRMQAQRARDGHAGSFGPARPRVSEVPESKGTCPESQKYQGGIGAEVGGASSSRSEDISALSRKTIKENERETETKQNQQ
jgi:hypothetical protein